MYQIMDFEMNMALNDIQFYMLLKEMTSLNKQQIYDVSQENEGYMYTMHCITLYIVWCMVTYIFYCYTIISIFINKNYSSTLYRWLINLLYADYNILIKLTIKTITTHTHTRTYTHTHTTHTRTYTHTLTHTYLYPPARTHTYIYTHAHTHTRVHFLNTIFIRRYSIF